MTLRAESLDFGHPGRVVGRGLDLAVEPGEVLCVLGPNGAGKSTLLRTLLGLLPPLAGRVTLDGRDMRGMPRHEVARRLAYVPQSAAAAGWDFSVRDTVAMGRTAHRGAFGRPGRKDAEVAALCLERLGLAPLAERPLGALSGGERQLALIARALATEAEIIVMDEPTAHLDFGNESRVLAEISKLRSQGIAVVLCTQDPAHALGFAGRALLLDRGQALALGPTAEVLDGSNLSRLYGIAVCVADVATAQGPRRVCFPLARPHGGPG